MPRALRVSGIIAIVVIVVLAFWAVQSRAHRRANSSNLKDAMQSVLTNPVEFAKNRVTGGVGVILRMDTTTGLPIVQGVAVGSPAETSGLRFGDLITQVDGLSITGKPLAQVVETIRGFTGGKATLTIQRGGTTDFQCVIRRTSWNDLRGSKFKQGE